MKSLLMRMGLVVILALPGALALAQDDQPVLGAVNSIVPNVYIRGINDDVRQVFDRSNLETGEFLYTDETGVALVTWFYDGTESVVSPNTRLTVNEFSGTSEGPFVIDLDLEVGHIVSGLGSTAAASDGAWTLATPEFTVRLLSGQLEATVDDDGVSLVVVTEGEAEVTAGEGDPVTVGANEYFSSAGGAVTTLAGDGITPTLSGACTATANTNLVVRMFPSENSQRLDGVPEGQVMWVRAGTEGNLWLQIYFQTDPLQADLHNFGWVYGPATTLDESACAQIPRAVLIGRLYGGPGVDNADDLVETAPIEEEEE